jgi:hypothetical protein
MFGDRLVIPKSLQKVVIRQLHKGHPGIVNMKMIARSHVYWPKIDSQLEEFVKQCSNCQSIAKDPVKSLLYSWPTPEEPWERVHVDYAGPIKGKFYFIIIDSFSKFPVVYVTNTPNTSTTISKLAECFSMFGDPVKLVTDNATYFKSAKFEEFCLKNGIEHITTPAFHPQSNGQVERFVDTLKRALKKMEGEGSVDEILPKFLKIYRTTPSRSTKNNQSPADNIFKYKFKNEWRLLKPQSVPVIIRNHKEEAQFNKRHGAKERKFRKGEKVAVKRFFNNKSHWRDAIIIEKVGNVLYNVLISKTRKLIRAHANQIRKVDCNVEIQGDKAPLDILMEEFMIPQSNQQPIQQQLQQNEGDQKVQQFQQQQLLINEFYVGAKRKLYQWTLMNLRNYLHLK